jgi:thiol:disulfide interchange protein DsbA
MRKFNVLFGFLFVLLSSLAVAQELRAGRDYDVLPTPQPTEAAGKVEVVEFFSYMCPHCAHFEPALARWAKALPRDVVLRRVPVIFRPQWEAPARLFYTLETMNEIDRLHGAVFAAIHEQRADLMSEKGIMDWAAKQGLDLKKFRDIYGSFALQGKLQRSRQMAAAYGVSGVPMMAVAGKYRTPTEHSSGSHEDQLRVVDALIAKARGERK